MSFNLLHLGAPVRTLIRWRSNRRPFPRWLGRHSRQQIRARRAPAACGGTRNGRTCAVGRPAGFSGCMEIGEVWERAILAAARALHRPPVLRVEGREVGGRLLCCAWKGRGASRAPGCCLLCYSREVGKGRACCCLPVACAPRRRVGGRGWLPAVAVLLVRCSA